MTRWFARAVRFTICPFRCVLLVLLAISLSAPPVVLAQSAIRIEDRGVTIEFPDRLTFRAHVESGAEIDRVILEYGVEQLTCGEVMAKAFPDFKPGASADVEWTWEMLQSGSQPPGAKIWYRWRVIDKAGNQSVSDEQRVTWLDDAHDWQSISQGLLTFHWYSGSRDFAEDLLGSAVDSLQALAETTGVAPQSPIDLYIYANTDDMRDAVLYEPGWTGGQAFPDYDILIIGIGPDQVDWGKDTEAHELTHILVGHLTFSCLGSVPTWLNEGIAVYGEGGLDSPSTRTLDEAIRSDQLISVRALSGGFSEHPGKADLSYAQSYSLVNFLVERYGSEKLLSLFRNLRDGLPIEKALGASHGFGIDALEDQWRAAIGAKPRREQGGAPTATPPPTPVPTIQPISGVPAAPPLEATSAPKPTRTPVAAPPSTETSPELAPTEAASASAETPPRQADPVAVALFVMLVVGIGLVYLSIHRKRFGR